MFNLINQGGVVMYIIALLSPVAAAIIIERFIFFRRIRIDEDAMISRLKVTLEKGHFDEAASICENNPSPITNLMKVGIEYRDHSRQVIKEAITAAANSELPKLERYLSTLGTIAHVAPLLGLLGTVTGNIKSFGVLADPRDLSGSRPPRAGNRGGPSHDGGGLIVSIPAVVFYNYLVSKVNHTIIRLENRVNELVILIGKGD
jgi:biopolymer transport protein ExbB